MAEPEAPNTRLWHGQETVDAVRELLRTGQSATIVLPETYHHALVAHLCPETDPLARPETIERSDGAELVAQVAEVSGLETLRDLVDPVREAAVSVRVTSPSPTLALDAPDRA